MALNHYLIGSVVVMVATCDVVDPLTDEKTRTDPSTVTFTREQPDGTMSVYTDGDSEVTNLAVGVWGCTVTADMAGRERWRFQGTGACAAVSEDAFNVIESSLPVASS